MALNPPLAEAAATPSATGREVPWLLVVAPLVAIALLPVLAVLALALFGTAGESVIDAATARRYVTTTLTLLAGVLPCTLALGAGGAWLVTMCTFPGRALFEWALVLPLALPAYLLAIVYSELFGLEGALVDLLGFEARHWLPDIRSLPGAILLLSAALYPYVYLLARTAFVDQSIGAFEAARALGASPWRSFWRVALPMARPALVIGGSLVAMEAAADFGAVQILAVDTLTSGIYESWLGASDRVTAARLSCVLLGLIVLLLGLEYLSRRRRRYHRTGRQFRRLPPFRLTGLRAAGAVLACLIPLTAGFLLPLAALAVWALDADLVRLGGRLAGDAVTTFALAALAAAAAVLIALALAYAARFSRWPGMPPAVRLAASGYAVPGPVLALGVLLPLAAFDNWLDAFSRRAFDLPLGLLLSGSLAVLVYAYCIRFLALAHGGVSASLTRVTANMDDAARMLGHGFWARLRRVHLPLIRGGTLAAALLVFVETAKELPMTLILRPLGHETLATRAFALASEEQFADAAPWALAIAAIGILPVILLSREIRRSGPAAAEDERAGEDAAASAT